MAYQTFPYLGFGRGLNLRDKPDAVDQSECVDAMNVSFSERGAISTRPGYARRVNAACVGLGSYYNSTGSRLLLTTESSRLKSFSPTGGSATAQSAALTDATTPFSFARLGTPSTELTFAANGTDAYQFNGSAFTTPANFPKPLNLAVQAADNRLVAAGFSAANRGPASGTSSPSYVYFSDPGDPTTWGANNFVQLTPGDGEKIMGAVAWREFVFVFKQSKFFVFYGNSTDSSGEPVFNYRPVDAGVGLVSRLGIATTANGVYFVGRDGIYRTTGSNPEKISDQVEPLWSGDTSGYYTGGPISDLTNCNLAAVDQTLYMAFQTGLGPRTLVYDTDSQWFSVYDLPTRWVHASEGSLFFTNNASGYTLLGEHEPSQLTDNGSSIYAYWKSGWVDFGGPDIKTLRGSKLWGSRSFQLGIATDFSVSNDSITNVSLTSGASQPQWNTSTWGGTTWAIPSDTIAPAQARTATRGTTFSTTFRGNAPWSVNRITHLVRQVRQPGVEDD